MVEWFADQPNDHLFISSLTLAELWRGILQLAPGKKRRSLEAWFSGPEGPGALFASRVLSFDESSALIWARLMADGFARGRPRSGLDMIIAAVAERNDCIIATDNSSDFEGLATVNPLRQPT